MGIFCFVLGGLDPKGQNFTSEQTSISMEARGRGVNCGCSAMRLSRSWEFLLCFYFRGIRWRCVCMFFFVRAGRFKRPLGGDQEGSQLLFFAYRSFIIFGSARFGLHTTVLVKGLSCFIMMESCANLVFFLSSILFDYSNLFFWYMYLFFCDQ